MSQSANYHEAERWLRTAEEDFEAAQTLAEHGMYAQACFYAQQSAEKAVKAVWYANDADPWGHSIQRLITEFPDQDVLPDRHEWIRHGALLDQFYIPTRYPNGLPDLTPGQTYRQEDADRALAAARALVKACREWMTEHERVFTSPDQTHVPLKNDSEAQDENSTADREDPNGTKG